ncbi:hypothetical protein [Tateyamaria pelophila]|uniref:hypothetical protein n=1 Tax=Tateyamaria pelophila TaxID=328415 RepID=UPI001CBE1060|nr:hypothetical protein [Tateyamaria pelophila]
MTLTIGQAQGIESGDRVSAKQMWSGINASQLILSIGRLPRAGSWQQVHLAPTVDGNGRVYRYHGVWDLGAARFSVTLQPVATQQKHPVWVCCLVRQREPMTGVTAPFVPVFHSR